MDPPDVHTESEEPEAKEDVSEGEAPESPESPEVSRPPDGDTGETDEGEQAGSTAHKNPPLHNGIFPPTVSSYHSMAGSQPTWHKSVVNVTVIHISISLTCVHTIMSENSWYCPPTWI